MNHQQRALRRSRSAKRRVPSETPVQAKQDRNVQYCYQCDQVVNYIFDDGRGTVALVSLKKRSQVVKRKTSAETTRDNVRKYRNAGLSQAKVWVHPDDADAIRVYAASRPKTASVLDRLRRKL